MKDFTKLNRRSFLVNSGLAAAGGIIGGSLLGQGAWAEEAVDDALIAEAKKEGKIVLYTGSEESLIVALGDAFREKYGIQLEYQRLNSSKIASRYTAESEAGKNVADVLIAGDPILFKAFRDKGWVADLDPADVPELAKWPDRFKNDYSAVISINPHTMGTNTDLVPDLPTSWQDMLKPEFAGQMITVDLRTVGLVAFGAYDLMLRTYGEDFLKELGKQKFLVGSSGPASIQQVAAGGAKIFFPCSTTQAYSMINQGAPVAAVLPDNEPYTGVVSPVIVASGAPHPKSARLFANFLLTEKGQQILNAETTSPVNAPGTLPLKDGYVDPDMDSAEANHDKIVELMGLA